MVNLLVAIQFLTVAPPLIQRVFTPQELGRATGYFPLVGALIGGILAGVNILLTPVVPSSVRAVLVLIVWVGITGALHMDGLLDSFDGIFGGFTPESRLEIMKDERVGAFGFTAGVLQMLLKFSALTILVDRPSYWLILAPVLGRWGMTLAISSFPYARRKGLGSDIKAFSGPVQLLFASLTAAVTAWLVVQWAGVAMFAAAGGLVLACGAFITRRIPGLTGDNYGALCEIVEAVTLLGLVLWTTI